MMAGHHADPAQGAHITKRVAPPDRDRLGGADRHLHPAVRQRIPDAVEDLLRDPQLDVGKVAVKIDNHLSGALGAHDIIHRNGDMAPPAVGDLLALFAGDLHFFDNRPPLFEKPRPGRRELHVPVTPLKQRYRQPLLQLTHGVADGGRDAMQLLRCSAEAAVTRHGIHHFKRIF